MTADCHGRPGDMQTLSTAKKVVAMRTMQSLLVWTLSPQIFRVAAGEPNVTACPIDGSDLPGLNLPGQEACTCDEPMKYWTGAACCVRNAHWNGTACQCDKYHQLEHGLCCHIDDRKQWGPDRCGCYNGSYWNGNSCLPGGVSCPPNALWNGTCYCKPAHWASDTHPDVMVNGACCPKNAYFDWVTTGKILDRNSGHCQCLDAYLWNGTACVPQNPTTWWPMQTKLAVGIGGGIGVALLLAGCTVVAVIMYQALNAKQTKLQASWPLMLPAKAAWLLNHQNGANHPPRPGREKDTDISQKWGASHDPTASSTTLNASVGTFNNSTALDLLKVKLALSGTTDDTGESPEQEFVLVSVRPGSRGSLHPFSVADTSTCVRGGDYSQGSHNGKTDSAYSAQSIMPGLLASKKAADAPTQTPLDLGALSTGTMDRVEPGDCGRTVEEPRHEELWTRGVNPADVEILRDTLGQPVMLGRGAFAVVYLGRWQATLVAVKVMLANESEAAQREVQAEADILRGLRHPNVVLLMAVCISPGEQMPQARLLFSIRYACVSAKVDIAQFHQTAWRLMMVILEYCGGGNLHKALKKDARSGERRLGWYTARSKKPGNGYTLAVDIARGLAYLHHRQLIHFDIKPANVLLDHAWSHAKISDVGLSKCVQGSALSLTMRGTPAYMAPELISFKHAPSFAVDVYSFGVLLHHIITGEEPEQRKALQPLRVPEECSAAVASLYETCLQDDPSLRPTSSGIVSTLEKEVSFGGTTSDPGRVWVPSFAHA